MKKVSIVVPVYITRPEINVMTKKLLDDLIYNTANVQDCEIIVVNDGSKKVFIDYLEKTFKSITFLHNTANKGFAYTVNKGIRNASNDLILLLNNDVDIHSLDWLERLVEGMETLDLDIAAPKQSILDENWHYVLDVNRHKYDESKLFTYPVGWCLLVKRSVFEDIGLFSTSFGIGFWEDVSFAYKAKQAEKKMGVVKGIDRNKISHKEHTTFRAENISLAEQYNKNRKIFLDYILGKIDLDFPRL